MIPLAAHTFYLHGFLIDLIYVAVIAVIVYLLIALLMHREPLAQRATTVVVLIGLLVALLDNLN